MWLLGETPGKMGGGDLGREEEGMGSWCPYSPAVLTPCFPTPVGHLTLSTCHYVVPPLHIP